MLGKCSPHDAGGQAIAPEGADRCDRPSIANKLGAAGDRGGIEGRAVHLDERVAGTLQIDAYCIGRSCPIQDAIDAPTGATL